MSTEATSRARISSKQTGRMTPQQSASEGLLLLESAVAGILTAHSPMPIPEIAQALGIEEIQDSGSSPRSAYNRVEHVIRYALSALVVAGAAQKTSRGWVLTTDRSAT